MRIPGTNKLQRTLISLRKKLADSKGLILMYHRVAEVDLDPWHLCVTPKHFAEQLEVLQKHACPLSLKEFLQKHHKGEIPKRAVVVTFDDGYADNLYNAKPLLEHYGIPATIYVSTGYLGQEREFWWDELQRLLLQPGKLPEKLTLEINGQINHWELGKAKHYSREHYNSDRKCKAWSAKPGSRMFFYYTIWQTLLPLSPQERIKVLNELLIWANTNLIVRDTYRSLLSDELSVLGQGELIEIGAHTVTHLFLSKQPLALQKDEIKQSKIDLEKILNRSVTSFSYPFGNLSKATVELTKSAGFNSACSTVEDIVWQKSDRFQLPRVAVENWNGEKFLTRLLRWFDN